MFKFIISVFFLFISTGAFAGSLDTNSGADAITRRIAEENRQHIGAIADLQKRVKRLEQRRKKLCDSPAGNREVVCKQDMKPLLRDIKHLKETCLRSVDDRDSMVCQDQLDSLESRINVRIKRQKKRINDLKLVVESRRWSLGAAFGPQGTFVPGYKAVGFLTTDLSVTYETSYMGVSIQGGGQFTPNMTSVGGGVTAAMFWRVKGMNDLAVGPLLGGEVNDFGIEGSYHQHRVYGPVAGGFLRFTPVERDTLALDFTLRGGIKTGVHSVAPGVAGGNGINRLAMTPFIGAQVEVRFFVRD